METDPELTAMGTLAKAFASLDAAAITRVLRWAADRYKLKSQNETDNSLNSPNRDATPGQAGKFSSVASFFDAVSPQSASDKALAVAYWIQQSQTQDDFAAQDVNKELKHMGHGIGNITEALSSLMNQSPRLVIQKQKMGTSKQARKRYMVTSEGKKHVEQLMSTKGNEAT